jgi:hypothetical protein
MVNPAASRKPWGGTVSSQMPEQTSTDSGHLSSFVVGAHVGTRDQAKAAAPRSNTS